MCTNLLCINSHNASEAVATETVHLSNRGGDDVAFVRNIETQCEADLELGEAVMIMNDC